MFQPPGIPGRLRMTLLLAGMSLFCFALSVARHVVTDTRQFLFLNWNLLLAAVPWMATTAVLLSGAPRRSRAVLAMLLGIWILFFPNSPYILTDLLHLRERPGAPLWFDLVLILSFAWTGLSFGFASLLDLERLLRQRLGGAAVSALAAGLLFLSAFGIYLGRYLRWNSWDVLREPSALLRDVGTRLADPFSHPRTWGVTLLMGILLNMMYGSIKAMRKADAEGTAP